MNNDFTQRLIALATQQGKSHLVPIIAELAMRDFGDIDTNALFDRLCAQIEYNSDHLLVELFKRCQKRALDEGNEQVFKDCTEKITEINKWLNDDRRSLNG